MNVVLLRVGIDTGSGGIHGPLFEDGSFELLPIPDIFGLDERTYAVSGRYGRPLTAYFPPSRRERMAVQSMHVDPEWETFTYGDPSIPKSGLQRLEPGDLLVFYCGLRRGDREEAPALYLAGYFEVAVAGRASDFSPEQLHALFGRNMHVRHPALFEVQRERLVLVKGGAGSRLLSRAVRISEVGRTRTGRPLQVLSREIREVFGSMQGRLSIQRSPPRWVEPAFVERAAAFVRSLPG
jgi:hypothetical protein